MAPLPFGFFGENTHTRRHTRRRHVQKHCKHFNDRAHDVARPAGLRESVILYQVESRELRDAVVKTPLPAEDLPGEASQLLVTMLGYNDDDFRSSLRYLESLCRSNGLMSERLCLPFGFFGAKYPYPAAHEAAPRPETL